MARQLRLEFPGALYHVTSRGNAHQEIYLDDTDRNIFLKLLAREIYQQGWLCYAYCLMDNHYHLLLETPQANLSQGMRRLNGVYTQTFNHRHQQVGHLFQGRYKSILVDKESYLLELCRYVVLNPVRAGLVTDEKDWSWSSYRPSAALVQAPDWLYVSGVLGLFGKNNADAIHFYRRFVREGVGRPSPWEDLRGQIFLGSESFLEQMEDLSQSYSLDNVPVEQQRPTRLGREEILAHVSAIYGVELEKVTWRDHPEAYRCAAYLLRRAANMPLKEVAAMFCVSPSRISHIQRTFEAGAISGEARQLLLLCKVKQ